MEIINLMKEFDYLEEYCKLCKLEWGTVNSDLDINTYSKNKAKKILKGNRIISILGLVSNNILIGFISLLKYDGEEKKDLTPWYATMYVKKEYRKKGYSKILNDSILKEAKKLGYNKVYLKTDLNNYYEKFGAKYIETLNNGEKLYYNSCIK